MKVLVSDVLGEVGIQMFQEEPGIEVDVNTGLAPDELKSIIGNMMLWSFAVQPRLPRISWSRQPI